MVCTTREEARQTSRTRYFTGVACCNGHIAERFKINGRCVECSRESKRRNPPPRNLKRLHYLTEAQIEDWYRQVDAIRQRRTTARRNAMDWENLSG